MIPIPIPPPRPSRFVRDLDLFGNEKGGERQKKNSIAPTALALFLIVAVFLNTTAVFADDATSTDATITPDTVPAVGTTTDTTSTTTVEDVTPPTSDSTSSPADIVTDTSTVSTTDTTSTTTVSTSTDDGSAPVGVSSTTTIVTTSSTDETDGSASTTTDVSSDATSTPDTTSGAADTATSTDTGSGGDTATSSAATSDTNTPPPPPASSTPESADQAQSAVREQLESQLQAAYQAQLDAALAAQQSKLDAAEKADEETMKQELTAEIQKQLTAGCLSFDDGSYFCVNPSSSGAYAAPSAYENVYAANDPQTGSEQIYLQQNGGVAQITHTSYDNIQPVFNKDRSLIAWQGLVNDRWQIFVYDVATGVTSMISGGAENNINPTVDGRRVAWQGWDGNWEIYLSQPDASSSGAAIDWQTQEITHDPWANVEPQLAGGLLAWQSYRSGTWQIFVDDLANGNISQVSAGNGVNTDPHFLLTWNSEENGQSQTLQYDISSGAVSVLGPSQAPAPIVPFPAPPSTKNSATLPAGSATSSSSTSTSTKSQGDGDNPTI